MKRLLLSLGLLILISTMHAQITKRALFIGNSYTATNLLPQLVADVAESAGDSLYYEMNAPGGYTFEMHTTNPGTVDLIALGIWDQVVLQEQSQLPSFPIEQVETDCFPYAHTLDSLILAANPCTETMFFMTWGRKDGDALNCPTWPPVCTYEGMDSLLHERYMTMGADNNAEVAPVGAVWHYLRETHPEIELYIGDGSHPSGAGSYAAACTFYASIFRKDPELITYNYSIPADQAAIIRAATKTIVFDDLASWYIGTYHFNPEASFTVDNTTPFTGYFTNTSSGVTSYIWDFGDGTTSTEENPVHYYAAGGMYTVTLTATMCDTMSVESQVVEITIETEIQSFTINDIHLYPNPATSALYVSGSDIEQLRVTDISGKPVPVFIVQLQGETQINIASLPAGIYVIIAEISGKQYFARFAKD